MTDFTVSYDVPIVAALGRCWSVLEKTECDSKRSRCFTNTCKCSAYATLW